MSTTSDGPPHFFEVLHGRNRPLNTVRATLRYSVESTVAAFASALYCAREFPHAVKFLNCSNACFLTMTERNSKRVDFVFSVLVGQEVDVTVRT